MRRIAMIAALVALMAIGKSLAADNAAPVKLELLDEQRLAEDYWYPFAAFFNDGSIFCQTTINTFTNKDIPLPVFTNLLAGRDMYRDWVSRDGGKTWKIRDTYLRQFDDGKGVRVETAAGTVALGFLTEMQDGSIVGMGGNIVNHLLKKDQQRIPYITTLRTFKSTNDLVKGKWEDDFPRVDVPDLAFQKGDSDHLYTGNLEGKVVELPNGDWLVAMSGRFKQDNIRIPYHEWETYQFRDWVCVSKDKGRSWNYLATIGDPEKDRLPEMAEGYNETWLLKLKENTVLAVMRTGGNPDPQGGMSRYTYLASSISKDGGKTWSAPLQIAPYGVAPRLLLMKDGTIVCSSGRPGVFLIFSRDGGKTWTEPQWVTDYHTFWSQCSSGYTSIGEVEPGVLTILYDDVDRDESGKALRSVVKMRRYGVP